MKLLSIDPGLYYCGAALWEIPSYSYEERREGIELAFSDLFIGASLWSPTGIKPDSKDSWMQRIKSLGSMLEGDLRNIRGIRFVACELPQFFNSAHGTMVAAQEGLVKLTMLVGYFGGMCTHYGVSFSPIKVQDWKGQLPKEVVKNRIRKILRKKQHVLLSKDMWDAVGIGIHWIKNGLGRSEV